MSFEKVKEIIMETINCDEEAITMEASLKDDLEMDSLDAMELSMALFMEMDIFLKHILIILSTIQQQYTHKKNLIFVKKYLIKLENQ